MRLRQGLPWAPNYTRDQRAESGREMELSDFDQRWGHWSRLFPKQLKTRGLSHLWNDLRRQENKGHSLSFPRQSQFQTLYILIRAAISFIIQTWVFLSVTNAMWDRIPGRAIHWGKSRQTGIITFYVVSTELYSRWEYNSLLYLAMASSLALPGLFSHSLSSSGITPLLCGPLLLQPRLRPQGCHI